MIEGDGSPQSPFRQILPKCKLARDLKEAYDRCVFLNCDFCFTCAELVLNILVFLFVLLSLQPVYNRCCATAHQQLAGGELLLTAQNPQNRWQLHPPRGLRAQPQGHQVRF